MKRVLSLTLVLFLLCAFSFAQDMKLPRPSPAASIAQTIGLTDVAITYSRPSVKGRVIWGDLVPYDKVWRTGANEASTISFSSEVTIEGQKLAAGKYSLHTIPGKEEWTIIFNSVADQWGSYDYDQTKDALRVKVKPQAGAMQEQMMISFPDVSLSSARVEIAWEKLRVSFKIDVDTQAMAAANIKKGLAEAKDWRVPYNAANYSFTNNMNNKDEAMQWVDKSIAFKETFQNLRLKANMLARDGKVAEAIQTAEKAVKIGKENKEDETEIANTEKLITDWKAKK